MTHTKWKRTDKSSTYIKIGRLEDGKYFYF